MPDSEKSNSVRGVRNWPDGTPVVSPYFPGGLRRDRGTAVSLGLPSQTAAASNVSTGLDRPVRPAQAAENQTARRAAIASCRSQAGAGIAREGRRDRKTGPAG